jgi:two-component system chemotaxis sensor kinase CheA
MPGEVEGDITDCFDFVAPDSIVEISRRSRTAVVPAPVIADHADRGLRFRSSRKPRSRISARRMVAGSRRDRRRRAGVAEGGRRARQRAKPAQTIRVDLGKLDLLLNLVGELVIRNSILADRLSPADRSGSSCPNWHA